MGFPPDWHVSSPLAVASAGRVVPADVMYRSPLTRIVGRRRGVKTDEDRNGAINCRSFPVRLCNDAAEFRGNCSLWTATPPIGARTQIAASVTPTRDRNQRRARCRRRARGETLWDRHLAPTAETLRWKSAAARRVAPFARVAAASIPKTSLYRGVPDRAARRSFPDAMARPAPCACRGFPQPAGRSALRACFRGPRSRPPGF